MGRLFLEHLGGVCVYSCAECKTALTNKEALVSTYFTGTTGRAYLFEKAVNLKYSDITKRVMITGLHWVRDVSCKVCETRLGWMYEFATHESQRYKEGKVILEKRLVVEVEGIREGEHVEDEEDDDDDDDDEGLEGQENDELPPLI